MQVKSSLVQLIEAVNIYDDSQLQIFEAEKVIPFAIKRVYTISKCRPNLARGHHAHKVTDQVLFCIQGSVEMYLDDGKLNETYSLDDEKLGIYLPRKMWHEMRNISNDAIMIVFASQYYDETDYIRDYKAFKKYIKSENKNDNDE